MRPSSIFESLITARQAPAVEPAARVELTVFSPSMIADLQRFERDGRHTEIVEVIAASIRHARPLSMKLDIDGEQVVLTVIPRQVLVHGPIDLQALSDDALRSIKVLQVEPVGMRFALRSPSDRPHEKYLSRPLGPLLWQLALHGGRSELLPEISGPVVYRLSPGLTLDGLEIDRAFRPTLHRLRSHACTLQELSGFTGAGRERVQRLLNALYLQSGLILSRSHHDANRFSLRRLLSP